MEATIDISEVRQWKRYDEYRESGATWHSEIPASWEVRRLKFLTDTNPSKSEVSHLPDDTEVSFLPMEQVGVDGSLSLDRTKPIEDVYQGFTYFRDGDVLVAKITPCFENGKSALVRGLANGVGFGTTEFHVLRPSEEIDGRYLELVTRLHAFRGAGVSEFTGAAGQQRVPESFLNDYKAPLPSLEEQQAIAAFLDRETARIDALIGHKERLIALLEEKRQAVISHAVTRGLDPNAKMKDSGTDIYPSIPEHWKMTRVRYLCHNVTDGPHFSPKYVSEGEGVMFLSARNVKVDRWSLDDAKYVSQEDYEEFCRRTIPEVGDVLYTKGGTTGIARVVDLDIPFNVWVHIAVLKINKEKVNPYFLAYLLNGSCCYAQSQLYTRGATNHDLGLTRLINIVLATPTLEEQQKIIDYLDVKLEKLDGVGDRIREGIAHLHEYRTALISAAVTGQIDVREEATAQNG